MIKPHNKFKMNNKGQMVIIGVIFLILSLAVLFLAMQFLPEYLDIGFQASNQPIVQFVINLFPFGLFIALIIAFFKIVRSD